MLAAQIEVDNGNSPSLRSLHAAVLASLLASELAVRLIVVILPRGEAESVKQLEEAANAARRRLEQVELGLAEGGDEWRR